MAIEFLKRSSKPSKYHIMTDPTVTSAPMGIELDEDKCIGCAVCLMQCPSQTLAMTRRKSTSPVQSPACQFNCPAGVDVRGYVQLIAGGASLKEAWLVLTRDNPFPAVTGRVCPHPCESACNRAGLDKPVNINCIEQAVGDYGIENNLAFEKPANWKNGKIAVVGSGPSGLSCAYQLALRGYAVTVFEASSRPGGMLSHAIPGYRLPETVVRKEIQRILDLGVVLKLNTSLGKDITIPELKNDFDAVFVAVGAQGSTAMGIPGENSNVLGGLAFLRTHAEGATQDIGKSVVVVGGGNTAIDSARTARRLGADVTVVYRRTRAEMPAYAAEVEAALEEGINIQFLCAPAKISGGVVTCQRMELGERDESGRPRPVPVKGDVFDISFSTLIGAIGQDLVPTGLESVRNGKWIEADAFGRTTGEKVFAGGDAVSGPGLVSQAIGAGRKAALAIDAHLSGVELDVPLCTEISYKNIPYMEKMRHLYPYKKLSRTDAKKLDAAKRLVSPDAEEGIPFTADQAISESRRCMECGMYRPEYTHIHENPYFGKVCLACHNCDAICPQGAIRMNSFYSVDEGRWATELDIPVNLQDGLPNPLRLSRPLPFREIEAKITETEKVIYTRRSVRVFKTDPVPREMIERVLEAGRFAPTAGNCVGFKYVVITDRALMEELSTATAQFLGTFTKIYNKKSPGMMLLKRLLCLIYPNATDPRPMAAVTGLLSPQFGDTPLNTFFDAPVAIMVVPHALHISEPDLGMGIVCQNMVLAAHSLGLGTCYVGLTTNMINKDFKNKSRFKKKLGLKWPYDRPAMFVLLGYPAVQTDGAVPRDFPKVEWM